MAAGDAQQAIKICRTQAGDKDKAKYERPGHECTSELCVGL